MVFDTNVLASALLNVTAYRDAAADALEPADTVNVPDVALYEIANVAWQWATTRDLPAARAHEAFELTEALITHVTPAAELWHPALDLALATGTTVYDTLFIAPGIVCDEPFLTFDARLLRTFPEIAERPRVRA